MGSYISIVVVLTSSTIPLYVFNDGTPASFLLEFTNNANASNCVTNGCGSVCNNPTFYDKVTSLLFNNTEPGYELRNLTARSSSGVDYGQLNCTVSTNQVYCLPELAVNATNLTVAFDLVVTNATIWPAGSVIAFSFHPQSDADCVASPGISFSVQVNETAAPQTTAGSSSSSGSMIVSPLKAVQEYLWDPFKRNLVEAA